MVAGVSKIDVPVLRLHNRLPSTEGAPSSADSQVLYIGPENRLVETTIARIVAQTGAADGPFVFWGGSGSGKSLIGRCITHYWTRQASVSPALITTATDWARHVDEAGESTGRAPWLTMVDRISLFVIEDLDSLGGHLQAQYELTLMLDGLLVRGVPMVATCRFAPSRSRQLDARLVSRLMAGTLIHVHLPSAITKTAFVDGMKVSPEIRDSLLTSFGPSASLQEIQGLASRLTRGANLPIRPAPLAAEVIRICARYFGVTVKQLKGPSRRRGLAFARSVTVFLLRDLTDESFKQVGRLLGGRDHSTVLHAFQKINQQIIDDPNLEAAVKELHSIINGEAKGS